MDNDSALIGRRVRLGGTYKAVHAGSDHVEEFGDCVGVVIGRMYPDTPIWQDVRWMPSSLRYGYRVEDLELIDENVAG